MKKLSALHPIVLAAPAHAFFHLELTPGEDEYRVTFSVKDETNIRYYVIEGSDDLVSFEWLSRIYPKGNAGRPFTYNAAIRNTSFRCYRIRQVDNMSVVDSEDAIQSANINDGEIGNGLEKKGKTHMAYANTYTY
jgi:hypothetical protein